MDWLKVLPMVLVFVVAGCPADDAPGAGTDTDDEGTSTGMSTTMPSTTTPSTSASTSATSTSASTTDGTTTDDPTTGDPTGETTTTGEPAGVCVGIDVVGYLDEVLSPEGSPLTDPECDPVPEACGGDVVGMWNVETSCGFDALPNAFEDMCAGATQVVNGGMITGTRTFEDDNSYAENLTLTVDLDTNLDSMTCFGVNCDALETALNTQPGLTASCTDDGGGACDCSVTVESTSTAEGTWATADDELTITIEDTDQVRQYCATATRLDVWQPIADTTLYTEGCDEDLDCLEALGDMSDGYICLTE